MHHPLLRTGPRMCIFTWFVSLREPLTPHSGPHIEQQNSIGGSAAETASTFMPETLRFPIALLPHSNTMLLSTLMMTLIVSLFSLAARKLRDKLANQTLALRALNVFILLFTSTLVLILLCISFPFIKCISYKPSLLFLICVCVQNQALA